MSNVGKGNESSEFIALKWAAVIAGIITAIVTGFTAAGVIPQEGMWATVATAGLMIAKMVGDYAKSRGAVKAAAEVAGSSNPSREPGVLE